MLRLHNKPDDAWSAFNGKVYNITPYISFHPGGVKELMRVAGRDGTKLFGILPYYIIPHHLFTAFSGLTHAWVNADFMLDSCLVGFLVPEPSS
jgi:cytochrome b involved in lipid metabolism